MCFFIDLGSFLGRDHMRLIVFELNDHDFFRYTGWPLLLVCFLWATSFVAFSQAQFRWMRHYQRDWSGGQFLKAYTSVVSEPSRSTFWLIFCVVIYWNHLRNEHGHYCTSYLSRLLNLRLKKIQEYWDPHIPCSSWRATILSRGALASW